MQVYNALVDDTSRSWITVNDEGSFTSSNIITTFNEFSEEAEHVIEGYRVVQWVAPISGTEDQTTLFTQIHPWDQSNGVKIQDGGESLASLSDSHRQNSVKASEDSKYRLFSDGLDDQSSSESDIDIIQSLYSAKIYKGFSDTDGNIWIAIGTVTPKGEKVTSSEIDEMIGNMKLITGTDERIYDNKSQAVGYSVNQSNIKVYKIGDRGDTEDDILTYLQSHGSYGDDLYEVYQLNTKTSYIVNVLKSVERNTGDDKNATWLTTGVANSTNTSWYNEAFDGYYEVVLEADYKVGLDRPGLRVSVLDPNLCPPKDSKGDTYTKAFISQFRMAERSTSTEADGHPDGYLATYNDGTGSIELILPNLANMFISRPFFIPNANVQDIN